MSALPMPPSSSWRTDTGVRDLLTLDERHFRALRGPGGRPFRLLPADA
jgi:hypothetical protein